ncbi:MAG TPA: ferritin family protein [Spirochaetota bacterium]|nr:ferritin family protein [Spirochaetota bacterium]
MRFSTKELVDMAIGIEESGYYFYTQCRKKFDDPYFTELLTFLAEEELRHKELFEKMLGELKETSGVFSEDYYQYLKALGDERVFKNNDDVDAVVKEMESVFDVLKVAMTAEKDSVLFYSELLSMHEKDKDALKILNRLIDEERRHIVLILELKEKLELSSR